MGTEHNPEHIWNDSPFFLENPKNKIENCGQSSEPKNLTSAMKLEESLGRRSAEGTGH